MPTKQMYEIKLVETKKESHYVGYSDKYDEWKLKREIVYQPLPVDRGEVPQFSFLTELLGVIKSNVVPS